MLPRSANCDLVNSHWCRVIRGSAPEGFARLQTQGYSRILLVNFTSGQMALK
jgi:hypothetical protein